MALIDEIQIKQTFDPKGKNGGYKFESGLENVPVKPRGSTVAPVKQKIWSGKFIEPEYYTVSHPQVVSGKTP